MKRFAPLAALLALTALAACGQGQPAIPTDGNSPSGGGALQSNSARQTTVEIGDQGLSETSLSVPRSQTVVFVNGTKSDEQRLCIGQNGTCDMSNAPGAPPELLSGGFLLQPGASRLLLFSQPGTYHLTVTHSSKWNVTVTVQG